MSITSPTAQQSFASSEGLRALLTRLNVAGSGAWRTDPEAAALVRFAADRYSGLARKHGLSPEDAAAAAFEVMLAESTRNANDPWAVVTWAVRITLIAEERAAGLLTSTDRARRPQYSEFHDATRFSDYEIELTDYHPAFRIPPVDEDTSQSDQPHTEGNGAPGAAHAIACASELLVLLGWPETTARRGVDYVCSRLLEAGDRAAAYETLRRDKTARALLDLRHDSWIALLRIVLGHSTSPSALARRGVLLRVMLGETLAELLDDDGLVLTAVVANPARRSVS